jgi:toxin ParE1/3/4
MRVRFLSPAEHHRRCLTRRFPFGVIYTVGDDEIVVVAVMNLRREPNSWHNRT